MLTIYEYIRRRAKYVQILWSEKLVAITPDTILSTTRYFQNILPLCPSFSLLSRFRQLFTEYLIKPTLANFFAFFNEELLDFNQFTECHYTQNNH